ncbi:MAG: aldehyde dehydrogenase family protein [Deltaproteobacteria bacterium]|nr:MAG: aldehyde dehydrogenase family protein [Deltaproteobacteria bacterium]
MNTPAIPTDSAAPPRSHEATGTLPPTPAEAIDAAVRELAERKDAWVAVHIEDRVTLLERLRKDAWAASAQLVADAVKVKGIRPGSSHEADEWSAGPYPLLRNLRLLQRSLAETRRYGAPRLPTRPWTRPDGQVVARVFPTDTWDKLLLRGYSAEVWMDHDVHLDTLADTQAIAYRDKEKRPHPGKVALVLQAGNVSSIGPMDALYKLFVEDQVVVLKTNPVNDYVGRFVERAFAALIDAGFLRVVYGGVEAGAQLSAHPLVDEIHITGSDRTHDAIVFGTGEEGRANKAAGVLKNTRRLTSELGNVTPVIVVPGPWSAKDVRRQATNIVSGLTNNAGFNCIAHRVIVQHADWALRQDLVDAVRARLVATPTRTAYYPGAAKRFAVYADAHAQLERYGDPAEGDLPWGLVPDVDPTDSSSPCFDTEAFCGLFAETALPAADPAAYLREAVRFVNEEVWGTLACVLIVHPDTLADAAMAHAVDDAIAALRYGTVVVNHFPGIAYALGSTPWGAAPGHTPTDIQSGRGVVHNTYLFSHPHKAVVRGPFRPLPKPPWWVGNAQALALGQQLAAFEAAPSFGRIARLAWTALKG